MLYPFKFHLRVQYFQFSFDFFVVFYRMYNALRSPFPRMVCISPSILVQFSLDLNITSTASSLLLDMFRPLTLSLAAHRSHFKKVCLGMPSRSSFGIQMADCALLKQYKYLLKRTCPVKNCVPYSRSNFLPENGGSHIH